MVYIKMIERILTAGTPIYKLTGIHRRKMKRKDLLEEISAPQSTMQINPDSNSIYQKIILNASG